MLVYDLIFIERFGLKNGHFIDNVTDFVKLVLKKYPAMVEIKISIETTNFWIFVVFFHCQSIFSFISGYDKFL